MKRMLWLFTRADDGAVTVDWVVLTAAVVGLGMAVLYPIALSSHSMSSHVGNNFEQKHLDGMEAHFD